MPRQVAEAGSRSSVDEFNIASSQVPQFYATLSDLNAAWTDEPIPDTLIAHISDPPSEDLRWVRWDGTAWIAAFLEPTINCGWVSNIVVDDRSKEATETAIVRLNEPVPAGETYTVKYKTTDGTATAAEGDYTAIPLTTLTFTAGQREKEVEITILAKTGQPPVEEFYLDLSEPSEGSASFLQGSRLTIRLTEDTTPLILTLSDLTVNEAASGVVTASINREATGAFSFTWSTQVQVSAVNRAPQSVFVAVSSATATIPEGSTSVNLQIQTNQVNEQVQSRNQDFQVVVPQSSLQVAGGDTIATSGHDLTANVTVVRDQYVPPNVVVANPSQPSQRGFFFTGLSYTKDSTTQSVAEYDSNDNDFEYYPFATLAASRQITRRDTPATWPSYSLQGNLSPANQLVGAHFFWRVTGLQISDDSTTSWFPIVREGRIDVGVGTGGELWGFTIPLLPQPGDGQADFYAKPTYQRLRLRTDTNPVFTVVLERASGVRLQGDAATTSTAINIPAT